MPDRPSWADRIPEALEVLSASEEQSVTRQMVEVLLGVKSRRAQEIMQVVGATPLGKALVCDRLEFIQYLRVMGGEELTKAEAARRKEFAKRLAEMQKQHIAQPPCLVELDRKTELEIKSRGFDVLLDGFELGPGFITLQFSSAEEALQKLQALAIAAGKDFSEFEQRVDPVGAAKKAPVKKEPPFSMEELGKCLDYVSSEDVPDWVKRA